MQFIKNSTWAEGVTDLTERLIKELSQDKQVLWLLSGGSNVMASVEVMNNIPLSLSEKLSLLLADERYGPPGHSDSNWQQLVNAGFLPKHAAAWPVLNEAMSFNNTVAKYKELAVECFEKADVVIAQLGIGSDG